MSYYYVDHNSVKYLKTISAELDKSRLPGHYMAWIYHQYLLSRILWTLFNYDLPMTSMPAMKRKIEGYFRRLLWLPRILSSASLYCTSNALQLFLTCLVKEFEVSSTRECLQYRGCNDRKEVTVGINIRNGRRCSVESELSIADERLRQQKSLVGTVATGLVCPASFLAPELK